MYQNYRNQLEQQSKQDKMSKGGDEDVKTLEEMFKKLCGQKESKSLLKKYLKDELYAKLKDKKTSMGGTLDNCIKSGCLNPQSGVGIYACDSDAYTTFRELFDPIIKDYHKVQEIKHPKPDFGDPDALPDFEEGKDMIVSTRVRVGRSQEGFPFPPGFTKDHLDNMEKKVKTVFVNLEGELAGKYYPLSDMSKEDEKQLINDHFLFKNDDRCLNDALGYTEWPQGRGIYHNANKTFLVWVNEEDHLRIISMEKGGDLKRVYKRLINGIKALENKIPFAKKDELGYLTFCPTNLGTALRASVHIAIPHLKDNKKMLDDICDKYKLQPRGIHGEHTESEGGVFDISNKRRLGLTEFQAMKEMADGVKQIIKAEKDLAAAAKK